jgi:hypothetical protein
MPDPAPATLRVVGVRVQLAGDSEAWEEPVRTWSGLLGQRLPWAEGALRRAIEHGPAQLGSRALKLAARLDVARYAGQLLLPPIIFGAFAGAVVLRRPWAVVGVLGAYLTIGTGLTWDALRFEASPTGSTLDARARLRRSLAVGLFNAVWLAAVPGALVRLAIRRGPVEYAKMVHVGAVDRG